jgi:DNA replication and repair protein RecF
VHLRWLSLRDFRNYAELDLDLTSGTTAIVGANGQGKSNLVEAIGMLATTESFRGAQPDAMVRTGAAAAIVRGEADVAGRTVLVEIDMPTKGRQRVQVNRQRLTASRDLHDAVRVTVFAPDDLTLVKGGPAERRRWLDDLVVAAHPARARLRSEVDRVLRQRGALLKQAGGRLTAEVASTLDVWDDRLATLGSDWGAAREEVLVQAGPAVEIAYRDLAGAAVTVTTAYEAPWRSTGLVAALAAARADDIRRGVSTVGPHRDDVVVTIDGRSSRTHASQGEQRTAALALRLAAHRVVTAVVGSEPVLVLDDVFSELDPHRSAALVRNVRSDQVLLTTAASLPATAHPDRVITISGGMVDGVQPAV